MHETKENMYALSVTKTKAARYEDKGIKEMIPSQWSPSIQKYNRDVELGISHWYKSRQWFHKGSIGHKSRHDVYLKLNIGSIQCIKVNKKFGYAYLEEIMVTRTDEKEYKFYEADFSNLNQNDIEDMYMLKIQNKVRNIKGTEEFDLVNVLRMYIHRILKEGCLHQFTPYTIMNHPRGVVYEGVDNRKRLTMNSINSRMKYYWTKDDEKKTKTFIEKIEKTLKEQRRFGRLELFVGGRRDNTDYRLLIRPE
ncbi:hypothetical protein Tco_0960550 [Tanacetum coccineum]